MKHERVIDLNGIKLWQNSQFFGVNDDTARLAEFAAKTGSNAHRVCELGSGNGGLLLMLWARMNAKECVGVEIMPKNVELARRSVWLNSDLPEMSRECRFVQGDWRNWRKMGLGKFDLVVSNPPFWAKNAGRMSPVPEKCAATHEIYGELRDMLSAARGLLAENGRLCLILPEEREMEAQKLLAELEFGPILREKAPGRVLMMSQKGE